MVGVVGYIFDVPLGEGLHAECIQLALACILEDMGDGGGTGSGGNGLIKYVLKLIRLALPSFFEVLQQEVNLGDGAGWEEMGVMSRALQPLHPPWGPPWATPRLLPSILTARQTPLEGSLSRYSQVVPVSLYPSPKMCP